MARRAPSLAGIVDAHCHLDEVADPVAHARDLETYGVSALSMTVTPEGYRQARTKLVGCSNVCVGLGLHPWWVDGRRLDEELDAFAGLVSDAPLIGEVGLDLGSVHAASHDVQRTALERIVRAAVTRSDETILSLHSVHAAGEVLDVLEEAGAPQACTCILHWFSGSSDELARAVRMGCVFSVGERMLATRRGRAYAHDLPAERILLETDLPSSADDVLTPSQQMASLAHALELVEEGRGQSMRPVIERNSHALLGSVVPDL